MSVFVAIAALARPGVTGSTHRQAYRDIFALTLQAAAVFAVIGLHYATGLVRWPLRAVPHAPTMTTDSAADELKQLVYVSRATAEQTPDVLQGILRTSQRRNAESHITGVLYHFDGRYLQYLEGEPAAVDATMGRIRRDRRHNHVEVLIENPTEARLFTDWHMANRPLDADTWQRLARAEWPTITHLEARHPEGLGVLQAVLAQRPDQGLHRRPRGPAAAPRPGPKQTALAGLLIVLILIVLAWPFFEKDDALAPAQDPAASAGSPDATPASVDRP